LEFESPLAALEHVLAERPRVLALGEAHAPKGSEGIRSSARRVAEDFLPALKARATDLVIELLIANGSCGKSEKAVAERQRPIVENQAKSDQNEFVELGKRARALKIEPHALVPTCQEYAKVAGAGADDIDQLLTTIAAVTIRTTEALLARPNTVPDALLLTYGGALHNDVVPRRGREAWSFARALGERTHGAYVELDLIVPEDVKDTDSWRAFPWYESYQALGRPHRTLLYAPAPHSFALIFPRSTP
jgi:hypothetical protein